MKNKINTAYQKHLTLLNREDIEKLLKSGFNFYQIAKNIQKDPTTISKEIRKYKTEHYPSNFNNKNNYCKNKNSCTIVILIVIVNVGVAKNVTVFALNMN